MTARQSCKKEPQQLSWGRSHWWELRQNTRHWQAPDVARLQRLPAQALACRRRDGWQPMTWELRSSKSVFFGQHDRDDAPRNCRVGRIGRVALEILIVVDPMQETARPQPL